MLKLKINNVKIDFFAKKHAKVRRISDIPLPFYAYLTKKLTLTHLVLGVLLVNNEQATLTTNDFAVWGTLLQ